MASANTDEDGSGRVRVCEPCRRSKVRCEQPDPTRPCKRCAKGWRVCIPATRSQPPSKSTPSHSQLRMLEDRVQRLITICESNSTHARDKKDSKVTDEGGYWWANEPWSRRQDCQIRRGEEGPIQSIQNGSIVPFVKTGIYQIVDHGEASRLFHHYCSELAVTFPAVVFAPGVTDAQVRSSAPKVFLAAITAAAKVKCSIEVHAGLRELLFHTLESYLMGTTKYTLELLQAIVISGLWYTPVHRETLGLEQLCYTASDIATFLRQGMPWSGTEIQHLEARRTWLASYYLGITAAMRSSNPNPMPWDQYAAECVGMLQSSPLAQPSDGAFCYYVSLQQVAWDYSQRLVSSPRPAALHVRGVLQSFNQTDHARKQRMAQMNEDGVASIASVLYYACRACVYEAVVDFSNDPEKNTDSIDRHCLSSSPDLTYLSDSLQCTHDVISRFTTLTPRVIQAIPTVILLQVMHATVVMVTALISVSKHCSLGCHATRRHEMRVDQALDAMIEVMAGWHSTWPATRWTSAYVTPPKENDPREPARLVKEWESRSVLVQNIADCQNQASIEHEVRPPGTFSGPSEEASPPIGTLPPKDQDSTNPMAQEDETTGLRCDNMTQFLADSLPGGDLDAELSMLETPFSIQ